MATVALVSGSHDEGLPVLHWDPSEVRQQEQFEAFHQAIAPVFATDPLVDVARFSSRATDYLCGDLIVSRVGYDRQTLDRTAAHLARGQTDTVALQVYGDGFLRGLAGDHDLDLHAGVVSLLDLSVPFKAWSETSDVIWVGLPRDRLDVAADLHRDRPVRSWRTDTPVGRRLAELAIDLWDRLGTTRADEAAALCDAVVEEVDSLARPADVDEARVADGSLGIAVRAHLAAELDDLEIDVPSLCERFHCSRATLYRVFERDGGVLAHVRDQRLRRCFDELTSASADRTVAEVAVRWGFDSPSHFNRLFRRRFGAAPSAVRPTPWSHAAAGPAEGDDVARFHAWVERS